MKKEGINPLIFILSAVITLLTAYEMGDMAFNALGYTTERGHAFLSGFIILVCILIAFFIDRNLLQNGNIELSPFMDIAVYFSGTFILIVFLNIFVRGFIPVTYAVMLVATLILVLRWYNTYVNVMPIDAIESDDETPVEAEVDDPEYYEADNNVLEIVLDDDEEIQTDDKEIKQTEDSGNGIIIPIALYVLLHISFVVLGILALRIIQTRSQSIVYYLLILLTACLTILFKTLYRKYPSENKKRDELIGCIVISVIVAVYLSTMSILTGFVYLLGAAVARVVVPAVFDNWGTGGTEKVNKNKILTSNITFRICSLIILMIAVWLLSYGAVWETEYLALIAAALTISEN